MIYLDNASTSFPKPPQVAQEISKYLNDFGVSPGRGSYSLADKADNLVLETRKALASLLGVSQESRVAFTMNATHALNTVIQGFLDRGDHALACSFSHNSVIRPLETLRRDKGNNFNRYKIDQEGQINEVEFRALFRPETKLVILNHASNVLGVKAPLKQIVSIAKEYGAAILLDLTQSLVYEDCELESWGIDFAAGTGHKSLLGPSGVGFLYAAKPRRLRSFMQGGSGGSISLTPFHPPQAPYRFEAGTLNTTSIAGLLGGLNYLEKTGLQEIRQRSHELLAMAHEMMGEIKGVQIFGTQDLERKVPILSFRIDRALPAEVAYLYSTEWNIALRSGIQCAPWVHDSIGTLPTGTLRASFSHFNSEEEVAQLAHATKAIIEGGHYAKACA